MLSNLRVALLLLSRRDRIVLILLVLFQFALAVLDLVAIAALGVVTSMAASSVTGQASVFLPRISELFGESPSAQTVLGVAMLAGDAFGVMPPNAPEEVGRLLARLSGSADGDVVIEPGSQFQITGGPAGVTPLR